MEKVWIQQKYPSVPDLGELKEQATQTEPNVCRPTGPVKWEGSIISQSVAYRAFTNPQMTALIKELWPKRRQVSRSGELIKTGRTMRVDALLSTLTLSTEELGRLVNTFNKATSRKGIKASVRYGKSVILVAET
jgi:hypothetical protein